MVAFPDVQILDVTGPLEVFGCAARMLAERSNAPGPAYRVEIVASRAGAVTCSSGMRIVAERGIRSVAAGVDTLLVAGGIGTAATLRDAALVRWLRALAPRVRRLGSVCSGRFLLAEAGLLDGRRATTHWAWCATLAKQYPRVTVEPDPIFVRDGNVYTSAGVTAGMDLALALVEEDHGRDARARGRAPARHVPPPSGRAVAVQRAARRAERRPRAAPRLADVDQRASRRGSLGAGAGAARVAMSPRNFARVFTREVGMTPARFVESVRVEAARRRLEESVHGVESVAASCGFGTAESMRRAFLRIVRVPPAEYRHRFRATIH